METAQQQQMYNCGGCPGGPLIILSLNDLIKRPLFFYLFHLGETSTKLPLLSSEVMKNHHFFFHTQWLQSTCVLGREQRLLTV